MMNFTPPPSWIAETPIHANVGTFEDLATQRLPELQEILEQQVKNSIPLSFFAAKKAGAATLSKNEQIKCHLKTLHKAHAEAKSHTAALREIAGKRPSRHDFSGVYVFIAEQGPFYVGITRTIYRRIQAHVRNRTHNAASLLFNMVRDDAQYKGIRAELDFNSERAAAIQAWLQNQKVAILPLASPVERYALELYAAMSLKTGRWNTFETH